MKRKLRSLGQNVVFLGLPTAVFCVVLLIPFCLSVFYALTDWNGVSKSFNFIWLENFQKIFSGESNFSGSICFTAALAIIDTFFTIILGVGLAALLTSKLPGSNFFRAAFFLPNTLGGIVLGYIWKFIFIMGFGYIGKHVAVALFQWEWLGTFETSFAALIIVSVWQALGYVMVIMIAALVGVPSNLCESALVDGANRWQIFFHIKMPYCMPYLTVCIFWTLAQSLKMFDLNVSMTGGGPYGSTVSMALQIYRDAFTSNNYGYANAEGVVFFMIILVITSLQIYFSKKKEARYQ